MNKKKVYELILDVERRITKEERDVLSDANYINRAKVRNARVFADYLTLADEGFDTRAIEKKIAKKYDISESYIHGIRYGKQI